MENTALIREDPRQNVEIMPLYQEAQRLLDYANSRIIASDEDTKAATNDLSIISQLKKSMEAKRQSYLLPFHEHVKQVNEIYKTLMLPVETADTVTRKKILAYRADVQRKVAEIEAINRMRQEAAEREAKLNGTGEITESIVVIEAPALAPKTVRADIGAIGTSKIWKFEVDDLSKVPAEYLIPDMVKIGKVVRAGVKIPGIKSWQEDSLRVTTSGN